MKFGIRDILWLTALVAILLGWFVWWRSIPRPGETVSGWVTVAGKPLATGCVYLHSGNQILGGYVINGKYTIERVPVGTYPATAEGIGISAKWGDLNSGLRVVVGDGGNQIDFNLN